MVKFLAETRKAVAAGVAAAVAAYITAAADGNLSQQDVATILGMFVAGAVLVFFVPNKAPAAS